MEMKFYDMRTREEMKFEPRDVEVNTFIDSEDQLYFETIVSGYGRSVTVYIGSSGVDAITAKDEVKCRIAKLKSAQEAGTSEGARENQSPIE